MDILSDFEPVYQETLGLWILENNVFKNSNILM